MYPSSVHPSYINIFKRLLLWSREADSYHIKHVAFMEWVGLGAVGGGWSGVGWGEGGA